jgi:hypothetical protein
VGGGGGSGGGYVSLSAQLIVGTGTVSANGGAGGNGFAGSLSTGGGGGGGGGYVGIVVGGGTFPTATATGGAAGLGGAGGANGTAGTNGQVCLLGGPGGSTGPTGATGPTGPTGPTGAASSVTGPTGAGGAAGATGPTGAANGSINMLVLTGRLDENVSGTNADFTPTGGGAVSRWYLTANLGARFSGFAVSGGNVDGMVIYVYNPGSSTVTLLQDDGSHSTAANRFLNPGGEDWTINAGGVAQVVYDSTALRWRTGPFGTTVFPGITVNGGFTQLNGNVQMTAPAVTGTIGFNAGTLGITANNSLVAGNMSFIDRVNTGAITGTVNNVADATYPGFDNAFTMRVQTNGVILTGFLKAPIGGANVPGNMFVVENLETSTSTITFANRDSGSSTGNQIATPTGAGVTITPGHSATLLYDSDSAVWRIIATT